MMKLGLKHVLQKNVYFMVGSKISDYAKNWKNCFFYKFLQFFVQVLSYFLALNGLINSTMTNPVISSRQFGRDNGFLLELA